MIFRNILLLLQSPRLRSRIFVATEGHCHRTSPVPNIWFSEIYFLVFDSPRFASRHRCRRLSNIWFSEIYFSSPSSTSHLLDLPRHRHRRLLPTNDILNDEILFIRSAKYYFSTINISIKVSRIPYFYLKHRDKISSKSVQV